MSLSASPLNPDDIVVQYLPMVKKIAGSLFGLRFFDGVPFEEYVQFGAEGLLQAIQRYDPTLGAKFETYAQHRIKGAIMSGLEKSTEVNQQVATLRRMAQERIDSLIDAADEGQPRPQVTDAQAAFDRLVNVSLGLAVAFMLDDSGLFQSGTATSWDDGPNNLAYKQLQQRLMGAMNSLNDKERAVLEWHYFQHESFEVAAQQLGLSKGRISQLHRSALQKLRQALTVRQLGKLIG
ncbi:MAG: sigma-70 family RNA polymerase sigma factor [Aquabacterium sp.]